MLKINLNTSLVKASKFILVVTMLLFYSCRSGKNAAITPPINAEKRRDPNHEDGGISSKNLVRFEYLFFNANREKILGNYDDAAKLFIEALDANPNSAAAMYELAGILEQKHSFQHALYYSKKAALSDPENKWYQLLYIDCLKYSKKWADLVTIYQSNIKKEPNNKDNYFDLSTSYLNLNKPIDAIKVLDDYEQNNGFDAEVKLQKIKTYKDLKNLDKAISETMDLIAKSDKEYSYYGILGDLYQTKGDKDKALDAYTKMVEVDPSNPYSHLTLADYYRNQKQNDKSFIEIQAAFKSPELDIDTKVKILLSYYYITETYTELRPDANTLCEILVQVHPDEAKAFSMYADFLFRDKKLKEAQTNYRKAIALDKEKFTLWNQLFYIDSELNENEALEKESKEAMELFPSQPLTYLFNGLANIQLKKYNEAITSLNQGKEYVIDNPILLSQFYGYIGDAYNSLEQFPLSDDAYDKALLSDKKNIVVMNNYAYYLSLRNVNLEKAEALSKRSNGLDKDNSSYQDTYGWVLYKMGKYKEAKIWIWKAINNGGENNGTLLEHYGDILYKLDDIENAVKYWEMAKKTGDTTKFIDQKIADKKLYE